MPHPCVNECLTRHDRDIAAIRKLILQGMRMITQIDARLLRRSGEQIETRREFRELRASQRETDRQLQAFMRSMRGGANGHTKRNVDL